MKGYRLDLTEFTRPRTVIVVNEQGLEEATQVQEPYGLRLALVQGLLLSGQLSLSGYDLYERFPLANRLQDESRDSIVLDEKEWGWLANAAERVKGFGFDDYEMVRRIKEAPVIEEWDGPKAI